MRVPGCVITARPHQLMAEVYNFCEGDRLSVMPYSRLIVTIKYADGIRDLSLDGKGASYVTLQCGSQVSQTDVAKGAGAKPSFNTTFEFKTDQSTNALIVHVFSLHPEKGYRRVGQTTLDLKTMFSSGATVDSRAFLLSRRTPGKFGGYIFLSLTLEAMQSPYSRQQTFPLRSDHQHSSNRDDEYRSRSLGSSKSSVEPWSPVGGCYGTQSQSPYEDFGLDSDFFDGFGAIPGAENNKPPPPKSTSNRNHPGSPGGGNKRTPQSQPSRLYPGQPGKPRPVFSRDSPTAASASPPRTRRLPPSDSCVPIVTCGSKVVEPQPQKSQPKPEIRHQHQPSRAQPDKQFQRQQPPPSRYKPLPQHHVPPQPYYEPPPTASPMPPQPAPSLGMQVAKVAVPIAAKIALSSLGDLFF